MKTKTKYKQAIFPIIEDINVNAYRIARVLCIIGLLILFCSATLIEIGTLRTILAIAGFIFISLPFVLRFVIDTYKIVGSIKFTEFEILTKLTTENPKKFDIHKLDNLAFVIIDYEGEYTIGDILNSVMSIRSGTENEVSWRTENNEYQFKFKLESDNQKRKALFFAKRYKEQST